MDQIAATAVHCLHDELPTRQKSDSTQWEECNSSRGVKVSSQSERERAMMKRKISTFLANRSERARARESGGASLKTTSSVGAKRSYKSK